MAGGAEVYTHEISRRLVRMGNEVILVTSRPEGLPEEEVIDGYKVIRSGNRYTVYLNVRKVYRRLKEEGFKPDVIIDEVNTIPFMTPKFAEEPIIMLIHQLCRDCWRYAISPLIQPLGWLLERRLHRAYIREAKGKLKAIITVSNSTKLDLIELGYPEEIIQIVPNGINWELYKNCYKISDEKDETVSYLGRITPYKRLEDLIRAWNIVEKEDKEAELVIAGRPDPKYIKRLKGLSERLELKRVNFKVRISEGEKLRILAKSKALIYTSIREGWGQTVVEAAACKTPTIAYNVPGLRDSVKHMETGILVEPENIKELSEAIIRLLRDEGLRKKLSEKAFNYSKTFSWESSARMFYEVLKDMLDIET